MPRRYGQHFLHDLSVVNHIIEVSRVTKDDAVLEIGPGEGALTRELAEHVRKIIAIEIDRHLFALLDGTFPEHVEIRLGDIMSSDLSEIKNELGEYHVVANLPYDITTDILKKLLADPDGPKTATLMMQKEVGERIVEKNGKTSRLSLFCGYFSVPTLEFSVGKGAFTPPPKVDSCVMHFARRTEPQLNPEEEKKLFALTETAFAQKRKKVGNTLKKILGGEIREILLSCDIDPSERPEKIRLDKWMSLARKK